MNDSNLRLIESALGVPVFACGNELTIEDEGDEVRGRFRFVIDRILDELARGGGGLSDEDLVRSVLNLGPGANAAGDCSITIPGGLRRIHPRTDGQAELVRAFRRSDVVFAIGPAGSGKTFLAVCEALRLVLGRQKGALVLTRPVVEAGESLGYLPGDLQEKINPYIRPLYDVMNAVLPRDAVRKLTEGGVVEVAPLAYMRGRTLRGSVIILDEAQNTTREQMKMFLTRMGEDSKVFVTGDVTQTDLPRSVPSGLLHAAALLRDVPGIAIRELSAEDVVRNDVVKRIIRAYEEEYR